MGLLAWPLPRYLPRMHGNPQEDRLSPLATGFPENTAATGLLVDRLDALARAAAPVSALIYPAIIWCATSFTPLLLAVALVVPVIGWHLSLRTARLERFRRARRIALATVGVPPLFTLAGVVLDGQRALPVRGLGMWLLVWSGLTLVALLERPRDPVPTEHARPERLAVAHGVVALPVIMFTIAHLFNHVLGIVSGELHIVVMDAMRQVYRMPAVEIALMVCVAFQVVAGLWLTRAKLRRVAALADTLQIAAGVYLTCFFASHLTATFRARLLRNVDTNWTWLTGANLLTDAWSARLTPYYFLAVVAVGVHVAYGLRYVMLGHGAAERVADRVSYGLMAVAVAASAIIMTGLVRASL
jgi:succinate dehydrogenase/fumarate reductase cytochrome b subunit